MVLRCGPNARALALDHLSYGLDVRRRRAATAADDVQPAVVGELLKLPGERLGRLFILAVFVWQPGIRITGHERTRHLVDGPDVVGHELRSGGAVQPDGEQVGGRNRRIESVGRLAGQHRPHRFDGAGDHRRDAHAILFGESFDGQQRRLDVACVLAGFDK